MITKIIRILVITILICFSFYYTEKSVDMLKDADPVMKDLKSNINSFEVKSINSKIDNDVILPGYNGLDVDIEKSYQNMKRVGKYIESRVVLKETSPTISIKDNYNKYIIKGNYLKDSVSLVFDLDEIKDINRLVKILDAKNVIATFITSKNYLENNQKTIYTLAANDHEIELKTESENDLVLMRNTLKNIINYSGEYCYTNKKNAQVLKTCEKAHMHTIIPTFSVSYFKELKQKLESGAIIKINNNEINELPTIINYIKQRGYNLDNIFDLLSEDRVEK